MPYRMQYVKKTKGDFCDIETASRPLQTKKITLRPFLVSRLTIVFFENVFSEEKNKKLYQPFA
jgi:hypothetical protein